MSLHYSTIQQRCDSNQYIRAVSTCRSTMLTNNAMALLNLADMEV